MAKFIITRAIDGDMEAKTPVTLNGKPIDYTLNEPTELTEDEAAVFENADSFTIRPASEDGQAGDGAAVQFGGSAGGVDSPQREEAPDRTTTDITPTDGATDEGSGDGDNSSDGDSAKAEAFDADAVRKGTLKDVEPRIAQLQTAEEIEAVRKAEKDADGRVGVGEALDARLAEIEAAKGDA